MIRSLMNYPNISARAIINTLPYKLKEQSENILWRGYMAKGVKILTGNTANFAGGSVLTLDFSELIDPEIDKETEMSPGETTKRIKNKLKGDSE